MQPHPRELLRSTGTLIGDDDMEDDRVQFERGKSVTCSLLDPCNPLCCGLARPNLDLHAPGRVERYTHDVGFPRRQTEHAQPCTGNQQERMWLLNRSGRTLQFGQVVVGAIKGHALLGPGTLDDLDSLFQKSHPLVGRIKWDTAL